jgi:hypothetical protein
VLVPDTYDRNAVRCWPSCLGMTHWVTLFPVVDIHGTLLVCYCSDMEYLARALLAPVAGPRYSDPT